jgi:hypothetical protein
MIRNWFLFLLILLASVISPRAIDDARLQAVEASVQISENPPQIRLVWAAPELPAARYRISKRAVDAPSLTEVAVVDGSATSWTDTSVAVGQRYEYRIIKETNDGYLGHSYLMAGIRAPILEDTGQILLLVRDNISSSAGAELEQLRKDLILEGWEVLRQDVSGSATPPQVRSAIINAYNASGGKLKQVILIGHVAVPYSGNIFPDGHDNHKGAWPADGYYGDVSGTWTDSTVNTQTAERDVNWNVPGDGKFDQGTYPAVLKLAVGRIDFFEMTCYANKPQARSEIDLTRQYLNKDHAFRTGQWQVSNRGLVLDNFGLRDTNGVSATAWANFAGFFGASANSRMDLNTYFPRLTSESALWTWTAGGGSYYYSSGIGTSDDYALQNVNVVFSLALGSYFGDWNNESNWLKAALGSGKVLVSIYAGIPRSFFHGMALGGTIGESFLLTENNGPRDIYLPDTQGTHEVHQTLLGDPTLRNWPRGAGFVLSGTGGNGKAQLDWTTVHGDPAFQGVHIYRAANENGPFTRITSQPILTDQFIDAPPQGSYAYMIRGVWLDSSGSGTFNNLGRGTIVKVDVTGGVTPPAAPRLAYLGAGSGKISFNVTADSGVNFIIEKSDDYRNWSTVTSGVGSGSASRFDIQMDLAQRRVFRVRQ